MTLQLPVMPAPAAKASPDFDTRLEAIREFLQGQDEASCAAFFDVPADRRLLKSTISLCPGCLRHVPAVVFARNGRVLMRKRCPEHGASEALVESDETFYRLSNKDRWGRRFAKDGDVDFPSYAGACCVGD